MKHLIEINKPYNPNGYTKAECLPAICGALMFCRKDALNSVKLREKEAFDNTFYMYKEDIDLSRRLIKAGWELMLFPSLIAYHCRGWRKRREIPCFLRVLSAKNELKLHVRERAPLKCTYSVLKYIAAYLGY